MTDFTVHFWPTLGSCTDNVFAQKICNGFSKFYRFIFESNLDSVGTFDLLLLYSFVIIFLAFLVASAFTVFEDDQKSLQQIKGKVKLSTRVITNLAATLWAIRETKFKSITYEGYKRICKNKGSILRLQEMKINPPDVEPEKPLSENATSKKTKSKSPKRDISPILKKPILQKVGIARLLQPQKKLNSIYNATGKRSRYLHTSSSSSSLRQKPSSLSSQKSQHSLMSVDKKPNIRFVKKVQIEDTFK